MPERPTCNGRSGTGRLMEDCFIVPRFAVSQPAGREPDGTPRLRTRHACGRHLVQVIDRITVPGRAVTVERLS